MDGLVGNVHGFGLTLDEIERLVKVHGCKWLRYYCTKCKRYHKAVSNVGMEHISHAFRLECSPCPSRCKSLEMSFSDGSYMTIGDAIRLITDIERIGKISDMLGILKEMIDGDGVRVHVIIYTNGNFEVSKKEKQYVAGDVVKLTAKLKADFSGGHIKFGFIDKMQKMLNNEAMVLNVINRHRLRDWR